MEILLAVPWYSDLLEDQYHKDKSEKGWVLASNASGWHTEMAKWIAEVRETELKESDDEERGMSWMTNSLQNQYGSENQLHLPCFCGVKSYHGQDYPQKRLMQSHS